MNTAADFLSRLESHANGRIILKMRGGVSTRPIELNIESTGITQEDQVIFHDDDDELSSEEELWQLKQEKHQTGQRTSSHKCA